MRKMWFYEALYGVLLDQVENDHTCAIDIPKCMYILTSSTCLKFVRPSLDEGIVRTPSLGEKSNMAAQFAWAVNSLPALAA